jgi:hypothetical protein
MDTLLKRWTPTVEDLFMNQALLQPQTPAQAKCTQGEDNIQLNHNHRYEHLHRQSAHME